MDDITSFIAARLAAVERVARAATQGTWHDCGGTVALATSGLNEITEYVYEQADLDHILLNQPAEVLRDVQTARRLLELHQHQFVRGSDLDTTDFGCIVCHDQGWLIGLGWCQTIRLIASRWADHPDYRPEWAPAPEGD